MGELYSFISFAVSYPDAFSALIDSYHTINSGVKNFLIVAIVLKQLGHDAKGIRLDSGDLPQLSKDCRQIMNDTGNKYGYDFSKFQIVASNDINEDRINEFNASGHEMDVYGIGTNLVTCQKQPALGMVYKVVQFQGTPRMKLSAEMEKSTLPGSKTLFRVYMEDEVTPSFDLLCLDNNPELEQVQNLEEFTYFTSKTLDSEQKTAKPKKVEILT